MNAYGKKVSSSREDLRDAIRDARESASAAMARRPRQTRMYNVAMDRLEAGLDRAIELDARVEVDHDAAIVAEWSRTSAAAYSERATVHNEAGRRAEYTAAEVIAEEASMEMREALEELIAERGENGIHANVGPSFGLSLARCAIALDDAHAEAIGINQFVDAREVLQCR